MDHLPGYILRNVSRPKLRRVESHNADGLPVLANKKILNDAFAVRSLFVGFEICAAKFAKVVENQMNRNIKGRHQTRSQFTHNLTTH
jgi:hypothetical protein